MPSLPNGRKAIRLAYVTATFPFGAGEEFLQAEVDWLAGHGHDLLIVPSSPVGDLRPLPANVSYVPPRRGALRIPGDRVLMRLQGARRRTRRLNRRASARALSVSREIASWEPDYIFCHWITQTATFAMVLSRELDIPWCVTAHRYDIVANDLLDEKLRSACLVRFISRSGQAMAMALTESTAPLGVVIPMGVALPALSPPELEREFSAEEPFVFLTPARMVPVKGHRVLLDAFARVTTEIPAAQLWLAGSGAEEGQLRGLCEALGILDRVQFLGHLPHDRILGFYRDRRVQCVVLPSLYLGGGLHEGIPVSLMEAMAHSVPVIGTLAGGVPELLGHGGGILVEPGEPLPLASAMKRICVDGAFRHRLGLEGRNVIATGFCTDVVMPRVLRNLRATCTDRLRHP